MLMLVQSGPPMTALVLCTSNHLHLLPMYAVRLIAVPFTFELMFMWKIEFVSLRVERIALVECIEIHLLSDYSTLFSRPRQQVSSVIRNVEMMDELQDAAPFRQPDCPDELKL